MADPGIEGHAHRQLVPPSAHRIGHDAEDAANLVHYGTTANGYDVVKSRIEFTDPKYSKIFKPLPMSLPALA